MRILILNADYPTFIQQFYASNPGLEFKTYEQQWNARANSLFGVAHYYSRAFRALGHDAEEVFVNISPLINAWRREHGMREALFDRLRNRHHLKQRRFWADRNRVLKLAAERIRTERPDLVLNHDMNIFDSSFFAPIRSSIKVLVGQHACTEVWTESPNNWSPFVGAYQDWSVYDLIVSSMPSSVKWFADRGAHSVLNRLGIDAEYMASIQGNPSSRTSASFVGSLSPVHSSRRDLLRSVMAKEQVELWTTPQEIMDEPLLQANYRGEVYGREMLETLKSSTMTLNHHGNVRPHANNMRLYEATGVGTLLITDWKPDLEEIFEPGSEVVAYRNSEECIEHIARFRRDIVARNRIAANGNRRVLSEHTYTRRMAELLNHLDLL
jgi:spore maturation protein CgeB